MVKKFSTLIFSFLLTLAIFFQPTVHAQGRQYQRLAFQHDQPRLRLTTFSLPTQRSNQVQLVVAFQIDYGMLSFKKVNKPGSHKFYATPALHIELFKSPEKKLKPKEHVSVVNLESVARQTWSDSVFAANHNITQQPSYAAVGYMQFKLHPGQYTFILEFNPNSATKRTSGTLNIKLNAYQSGSNGEIIFAGRVSQQKYGKRLKLINKGGNVAFTESFYALIHLPNYTSQKNYALQISAVKSESGQTKETETVVKKTITRKNVMTGIRTKPVEINDKLYLELHQSPKGVPFALVQIPNTKRKKGTYRIEVFETKSKKVIAQKMYQVIWFNKPVSLYNADIAIEMLHFIVDEATLKHLDSGSAEEKWAKLNEFWAKRDPTPNTEFNELKAEYYRRIDYVYNHFGSPGTLGFQTDRGRIYILYGPPNNIERYFPSEGASREIWTYDNRQFVFKATSGYGNYILIKKR